jgi:hypothetical protein
VDSYEPVASSARNERACCGEHFGSDIAQVSLAKKSGRRTIAQLRIQALEPSLGDVAIVVPSD